MEQYIIIKKSSSVSARIVLSGKARTHPHIESFMNHIDRVHVIHTKKKKRK